MKNSNQTFHSYILLTEFNKDLGYGIQNTDTNSENKVPNDDIQIVIWDKYQVIKILSSILGSETFYCGPQRF